KILSGTELSKAMRAEIAEDAARFEQQTGMKPGLATVLVGDDPASQVYVRMKGRAAEAAGFHSRSIVLPGDSSHERLIGVVDGLNADPEIHGILVQLPLPKQIRAGEVLLRIDPAKDVDAFHPMNMGRLASGDRDVLAPCTPAGIVELLLHNGYDPAGKRVVIVGRSNIVGRPLALVLLRTGRGGAATVTVTHSRTPDLCAVTRAAEILVAAAGRAVLVRRDMVKPGGGVNRSSGRGSGGGVRRAAGVACCEVAEIAGARTPVPAGAGRMAIPTPLRNSLEAATPLPARGAEGQPAAGPHE